MKLLKQIMSSFLLWTLLNSILAASILLLLLDKIMSE